MGSKSSPSPPDYRAAAIEEGKASKENLLMQNYANRPTQYTPFGSQTWDTRSVIDPATGQRVSAWTQTTKLDPALQRALDAQIGTQLGRSQLANDFMGRVRNSYDQPFNWSNLPDRVLPDAPGEFQTDLKDRTGNLQMGLDTSDLGRIPKYDLNARDKIANELMERMQPTHDRQLQGLQAQLAAQGYQLGSEGYTKGLGDLLGAQSRERFNALDSAGNEAQRMYNIALGGRQQRFNEMLQGGQFANAAANQALGMDISRMNAMNQATGQAFSFGSSYADQMARLRQQAIAEQQLRRQMPLNEMNALLTGQQVGMPQMPSFSQSGIAQTPQFLNAANMGYQSQLAASNAANAGFDSILGGVTSLAGSYLSSPAGQAMLFSDARLKTDIRKIGEIGAGISLYRYRWIGSKIESVGVLAQEVQKVRPDAVRKHPSGYLQVNYGGL